MFNDFSSWNGGKIILPTAFLPMNHQPLHPPWQHLWEHYNLPPNDSLNFSWIFVKAKSFRFPLFVVGIPFFFLQHCKWTTLTTRKKQQKTTYRCFLKIHDSDLFFQNSSDRERIFTAGSLLSYFPPIKGQACWMLAKPSSRTQLTLKFSQRCDSFWMFFGPKKWGEEEFYKHFDVFWLVVSTHLKNISQIGSFPQVGMEIFIWNHHLVFFHFWRCFVLSFW